MRAELFEGGVTSEATRESVERALGSGRYFWLDMEVADGQGGVPSDDLSILSEVFRFHPMAVADAEHFGQRPKFEDYDDYSYLVVHGAGPGGRGTTEVHLFFCAKYTVTLHRGTCAAVGTVRERMDRHPAAGVVAPEMILLYLVVDSLTDSFFPVLSAFDDQVDELEEAILVKPTEEQLGTLFSMKRNLVDIRRVVAAQRDVFAALSGGVVRVPGLTDQSAPYFRDLYDHLIRINDLVDTYRDLLSSVMDTHLSTVSNRLNVVMKQLAIIATIFLPLSFLTGFFGQNFAWLVRGLQGPAAFFGLGIGLQVLAAAVLLWLFKRRGWLGGPSA
jgi:magnesium transporter